MGLNKRLISTAAAAASNFVYTPPAGFVGSGGTFSTVSGDSSNFSLSNNDLTADHTGSSYYDKQYGSVNLTSGSGLYYAEFTLGGGGNNYYLGVIQHGSTLSYPYYDGVVIRSSLGKVNLGFESFVNYSTNPTSSSGDIISVYYNHSTRKVGFYVNGTDHGYVSQALDSGMTDVRFSVFGNFQSGVIHYDAVFE